MGAFNSMGLRLKLGLSVVLFVGGVFALVGYGANRAEHDILVEEMQSRAVTLLRSFAIPCASAMANNDTPTLDNYVDQFSETAQSMELEYMAVLDHQGRVVAHTRAEEYGERYDDPFTARAIASAQPMAVVSTRDENSLLEITVPVISGLRWGTLKAGFTLSKVHWQLAQRRTRLLLSGLAIALGAAAIAYLVLSLMVVRPVINMSRMAARFGAGNLDARVALRQRDEMGQLADQLNAMAWQIQEYTVSLETLVADRTRELAETNDKLRRANTQLERLATTDPLTGLFNRRYFMEQLNFEVRRGKRNPHEFALIMIDLDHFKDYNDANGHPLGDELLQRLAALLEINLRATDVVARYGGEEFIVLLLDTPPEEGLVTAQKLQQAVAAQPFPKEGSQPSGIVSASVGVAFYPTDSSDGRELIQCADQALYSAKASGRNTVRTYKDARAAAQQSSLSEV